jgi:putative ABC transport system permease protein
MNRRRRSVLVRMSRRPLRVTLMVSVLAIGIAAAVVARTLAVSFTAELHRFVDRAYPAGAVVVFAGSGPMGGGAGGGGARGAGAPNPRLDFEDPEALGLAFGVAFDPVAFAGARDVRAGGAGAGSADAAAGRVPAPLPPLRSVRAPLAGVSERAETLRRRPAVQGRFFDRRDVETRARVAMLGAHTAAALFPEGSAVGAEIILDDTPYEVRGVLEPLGPDPHGGDQDQAVWIPITTLLERATGLRRLSGATFAVPPGADPEALGREMTRLLRDRHAIAPGQADDFTVLSPGLMRQMMERSLRIFERLVPAVQAIVLALAGLFVGLLLRADVRRRTPEIGLRRAVGARRTDVRGEVWFEVAVIAGVAVVLAVALGAGACTWLAPRMARNYGLRDLAPSLVSWFAAFAGGAAAAWLGALAPARRAARIDVVRALRDKA